MDDDILKGDDEPEEGGLLPDDELDVKKKDLLDDDAESVEDLVDEELATDKADLMDDVDEI